MVIEEEEERSSMVVVGLSYDARRWSNGGRKFLVVVVQWRNKNEKNELEERRGLTRERQGKRGYVGPCDHCNCKISCSD